MKGKKPTITKSQYEKKTSPAREQASKSNHLQVLKVLESKEISLGNMYGTNYDLLSQMYQRKKLRREKVPSEKQIRKEAINLVIDRVMSAANLEKTPEVKTLVRQELMKRIKGMSK